MGRLATRRARWSLTIVVLAVLPIIALLCKGLLLASGAPLVTLVAGLLLAHLLSVGPRGYPVAVIGFVLEATITNGHPFGAPVLAVAAVQALVVVGGAVLLEARFHHYGPVRKPAVMIEFGLLGAGLVPLGVVAASQWLGPVVGAPGIPVPMLHAIAAAGIGVLTTTAGIRMVVKGQHRQLDRTRLPSAVAAVTVSAVAALLVVQFGDEGAVAASQILAIPVLALAMLVGTVAYSLAVTATLFAVVVPLAVFGDVASWDVATGSLVAWWVVGFVGLLLATDGDRRRAAAEEFRTFFDRSAAPSLTVNTRTGLVVRANSAVTRLLDARARDLIGRPLTDLVPDQEGVHDELARVRTGARNDLAVEFDLPGEGAGRWVRCIAVHVDLGGPQHDVMQVQFVDLTTERQRATSLERSNESLEQFGRRVTHDLKQPVAAVAAYASTLLEHGDRMEDDMVRTMHERLEAAARRAVQQLDDTFAAAAEQNPGRVDVRLHELVADVVGVVDIDLAEAGGTVGTNLMRGHVHSDPGVLRQILLNLLTNSLKYRRPEVASRIHVASRVRGAGVEVTVTDNGIGIPPNALETVFGRGVRLLPEQADGGGHGLADSRDLAQALGGSLRAEPWPDGARFVLWLPDPSAAGAQPATRVLVVSAADARDDLLDRLGRRSSIQVVATVATISEAVVAVGETKPDVILLDRVLHERSGLGGVVEMARAHRDARIVLLTAGGRRAVDVDAAAAAGAVRTVDLGMDDAALVDGLVGLPG